MNEVVNKFLIAFMPEMHLRQPRFTCSACGPFTKKTKKESKNLKKLEIHDIFNEIDKACFQHDIAHGDLKT